MSHSHIRFGSFQRLAYLGETEALARLVDHSVRHYFPAADDPDMGRKAPALLELIAGKVATMTGQWMSAGFVHGVMNTDNFNLTGETFDFGPYRFLPVSDPNHTAAYFDQSGLYRFGRQPTQSLWALTQLASALTPLADKDDLATALKGFEVAFQTSFAHNTLRLLGLKDGPSLEEDLAFLTVFYTWMSESEAPWPQVFFDWFGGEASVARAKDSPAASFYTDDAFAPVRDGLSGYTADRPERLDAAYFQSSRPTNLLYDEIEAIWEPIDQRDDWTAFAQRLADFEALRLAIR